MSSEAKSVGQCIRALKRNIKLYWNNRKREGLRRLLKHDIRLLRRYYQRRAELQAEKAAKASARLSPADLQMEEKIIAFYRRLKEAGFPPAESKIFCWSEVSGGNVTIEEVFERAWSRLLRRKIIERHDYDSTCARLGPPKRGRYRLAEKKGKTSKDPAT